MDIETWILTIFTAIIAFYAGRRYQSFKNKKSSSVASGIANSDIVSNAVKILEDFKNKKQESPKKDEKVGEPAA